MRLHPSTGLIMERHVPSEGAVICGKNIPAGTVVGINARVVHRNPEVFEDPDSFTPERWLDSSPEKLKEMDEIFLVFGSGARTCLGKYIFLTEIHKMIPELPRKFKLKLHSPEKEWKTKNVCPAGRACIMR